MPTCWWYELYCFLQYLYVVKLKGGVALEGNVVTILEFWNEKKKKKKNSGTSTLWSFEISQSRDYDGSLEKKWDFWENERSSD